MGPRAHDKRRRMCDGRKRGPGCDWRTLTPAQPPPTGHSRKKQIFLLRWWADCGTLALAACAFSLSSAARNMQMDEDCAHADTSCYRLNLIFKFLPASARKKNTHAECLFIKKLALIFVWWYSTAKTVPGSREIISWLQTETLVNRNSSTSVVFLWCWFKKLIC